MKNLIYTVVIALCIVIAVVVFLKTRGGGSAGLDSISDAEQVWVKCRLCKQAYQMGKKKYYAELEAKIKANPTAMMMTPPLTCEKCGKDGIMKAEKCEKCGTIFFENSVPNDFADRCPECKYSKTEAVRQERLKNR